MLAQPVMAALSVVSSGSTMASVFIMPPAVSSSYSSSSRTSSTRLGLHLLEDLRGGLALQVPTARRPPDRATSLPRCRRPLRARAIRGCWPASSDRSPTAHRPRLRCRWSRRSPRARPDRVLRRCRPDRPDAAFQLVVRDVEAQAPQRVGLDDVAELPADRVGRDGPLQTAAPMPGGTAPCIRRRKMLRMPTSTSSTISESRSPCVISKVMSLTRTTLRPLTSMICWSSRSRLMRSMYSSEWYG